jgi:hypothetical protein
MTKIHHATAKRAASFEIDLASNEDEMIIASWGGLTLEGGDAKITLNGMILWQKLEREYPGAAKVSIDGDDVTVTVGDTSYTVEDIFDIDGSYAEIGDEMGEQLEAAIEEVEDEEAIGSVVPMHYRAIYAERGNANHCGDWLAETLNGIFETDGRFDANLFRIFLVANGVPMTGKWASLPESGQKGWEGRYRMNGRQILEKYAAKAGKLVFQTGELEVPAEALAALRAKHAKWLAKAEKAEA